MKKELVFCSECRYYEYGSVLLFTHYRKYEICNHVNNYEIQNSYSRQIFVIKYKPCEKNANNNCDWYEPKFFKRVLNKIKSIHSSIG